MKIHLYLSGFVALCLTLSVIIVPVAVIAAGCSGGNCGPTMTLNPTSGPTGTEVTINVTTGSYPLDGRYEIWWSKFALMSDDATAVKVAEGYNERLTQIFNIKIAVPEASYGTSYFHYIKSGHNEQMLNFAFTVTPSIIIDSENVRTRSAVNVTGTGYTVQDSISFFINGNPVEATATTDKLGSFTTTLTIPDLPAGVQVIKATAKKMYNAEGTFKIKTSPYLKLEPGLPIAHKDAVISGFGFAASSKINIKFDDQDIASPPASNKIGSFTFTFNVPELSGTSHVIHVTDASGNTATYEPNVESSPPSTPTPITPTSERFGIIGGQTVMFSWMPSQDDSGSVQYTVEIADNLNFFPLAAGMRKTGLKESAVTVNMEPGTYYWRVQATDPAGNQSKWALSPYAFQVGLVNLWIVVVAGIILLFIFVLLLRTFIQRIRGYYY